MRAFAIVLASLSLACCALGQTKKPAAARTAAVSDYVASLCLLATEGDADRKATCLKEAPSKFAKSGKIATALGICRTYSRTNDQNVTNKRKRACLLRATFAGDASASKDLKRVRETCGRNFDQIDTSAACLDDALVKLNARLDAR